MLTTCPFLNLAHKISNGPEMLRSQVSVTGRAPRHDRTRRSHSTRAHKAPIGRAAELTRCVTPDVRLESSKGPLVTGRVRSNVTGRATASDRPRDLQIL
jgi:hypothetical protein